MICEKLKTVVQIIFWKAYQSFFHHQLSRSVKRPRWVKSWPSYFSPRRDRNLNGVTDGTRTHDKQNHNLSLYQLNYDHHKNVTVFIYGF